MLSPKVRRPVLNLITLGTRTGDSSIGSTTNDDDYYIGTPPSTPVNKSSPVNPVSPPTTTSFFRSPLKSSGSTPLFYCSPHGVIGSPKQQSFFPSPKESIEFVFAESPENHESVVEIDDNQSTLKRSNSSGLILVSLLSPSNKSNKSFIFDYQCSDSDCVDEKITHLNLKHVATIDEFTTTAVVESSGYHIFGVRFKVQTKFFSSNADFNIGNYVVVEGDRGIDVGVVVSVTSKKEIRRMGITQRKFDKIMRVADYPEYLSLMQKYYDEQNALFFIQQLVGTLSLPLLISEVEFQFDREKLIIYYKSAERYVDFRKLLSLVWMNFKTRVWMQRDTSPDNNVMLLTSSPSIVMPCSSTAVLQNCYYF